MQVAAGKTLTEVDVDAFLTGRRAAQAGFIEPSFPTIAGSGPHGAIIHYRAEPETCGTVSASQLLLVDSGARLLKFENMSEKAAALLCQRPTGLKGDYLRLEGFYRSASELA